MLRIPITRVRPSINFLLPAKNGEILVSRNQSTGGKSGSGGKIILGVTGAAAAVTVGGIVYAKYDPEIRNKLIETVPQTKWLFDNLFSEEKPKYSAKVEDVPNIPRRKVNTEVNASSETKQPTAKATIPPSPPLPKVEPPPTPQPPQQKSDTKSNASKTTAPKAATEHESLRKNFRLTEDLKKNIDLLEKEVKETLMAEAAAVEISKEYSHNLVKVLDSFDGDDPNAWNELNKLKEKKEATLSKANKKMSETRLFIDSLQENIKKAKQDKDIAKNSSITSSEEIVIRCLFQLDKSEKSLIDAEKYMNISENYQNLFNSSIEELEKELKVITSDGKLKKKPTEEELKLLVNHSHKKIKQLYKVLARLQATETLRVDEAVNLQKEEDHRVIDTKIALEVTKRKSELEIEYQKKMNQVKNDLENELKLQLKRQLSAYQEHLREQLEIQRMEVDRANMLEKERDFVKLKQKYFQDLELTIARLNEIEQVLKNREKLDKDQLKAGELWLFSQKLLDTLKFKNANKPKILANELEKVKSTAEMIESKTNFTARLIETLPKSAFTDGVYTEDDLIDRFKKVDKICKRVALVDEEGGSLFKYMLSFVQSSLLFKRERVFNDELENAEKWDTFEILDRMNSCLNKRDLETSLKYANHLKGKSKQVASDWISDLQAHLELRQAVEILQAQATALTLRSIR